MNDEQSGVLTFLIADVRGYSRYTAEYGDEAAARLAGKFVDLVSEGVEAHGGTLIEVRGDEALAVFTSARQAIRAAVDLQARFGEETDADSDLPLKVGIGIDAGEAVRLDDGSYRGAALNVAARLCGRAHGGEVIVSEATSRLAGRLSGLQYSDRGRVHLKNIPEPMHILHVYSELDAPPANRWVLMFFGKPGRTLGWKLGLAVVLVAAATAAAVVYLTAGDHSDRGAASPPAKDDDERRPAAVAGRVAERWPPTRGSTRSCRRRSGRTAGCRRSPSRRRSRRPFASPPRGRRTAGRSPPTGTPPTLRPPTGPSSRRTRASNRNTGRCNAFVWGGELQWLHGAGKPGGRAFCYFDGNDAVIVWTHERLGQPTHRDILAIAREGGSDHVSLTRWWRPWHHLIGKAQ